MFQNVLLLALSTFPYNKEINEYSINENTYTYEPAKSPVVEVKGTYQLDPIPKLLASQGILFDHILMLVTDETKKPKKILVNEDYYNKEVSPLDFFQESMRESEVFYDIEGEQLFIPIDLNESNPSLAIAETVNYLRKFSQENDIHLYVDSHGGFRGTQMVLEAILSLLAKDKIETHVFGIQFGAAHKNKIIEDETMKIFDFVSGINEFLNSGRIDSLVRYLDEKENTRLVNAIQEISEGIQWCNLESFELGIGHLRNYYKNADTMGNEYLQMFENRIRQDYGPLLATSKPDPLYVVRWCMKKGFYQQALTIIESRMTEAYLRHKLFYVTEDGKRFQSDVENRPFRAEKEILDNDIFNGCIQSYYPNLKWWNTKNYSFNMIFKTSIDLTETKSVRMHRLYEKMNKLFILKLPRRYRTIDELADYSAVLATATTCKIKTYQSNEAIQEHAIAFGSLEKPLNESGQRRMAMALFMHKTLKDIRNNANHALNDNPYQQSAVKQAVEFYLWLLDGK